jgi:hypothetical protein
MKMNAESARTRVHISSGTAHLKHGSNLCLLSRHKKERAEKQEKKQTGSFLFTIYFERVESSQYYEAFFCTFGRPRRNSKFKIIYHAFFPSSSPSFLSSLTLILNLLVALDSSTRILQTILILCLEKIMNSGGGITNFNLGINHQPTNNNLVSCSDKDHENRDSTQQQGQKSFLVVFAVDSDGFLHVLPFSEKSEECTVSPVSLVDKIRCYIIFFVYFYIFVCLLCLWR